MATGAMNQQGTSLLEWLVAISLNALVLLLITQALATTRVSFSMIDALARLADHGGFAQQLLINELALASPALACARHKDDPLLQQIPLVKAMDDSSMDLAVVGFEAPGTSGHWSLLPSSDDDPPRPRPLPPALVDRIDPQSDVILVHRRIPIPGVQIMDATSQSVELSGVHGLKPCAWAVLSDCSSDVVFQNTATRTQTLGWAGSGCQPGNHARVFSEPLWPDLDHVALYEWQTTAWFVGPSQTSSADASTRTLYRALLDPGMTQGRIEAMTEGIETLQLEYALKGGPWQSADQVSDWSSVIGVRFALVASAPMPSKRHVPKQSVPMPMLSGEMSWPMDAGYARVLSGATALRGVML